MKAVFTLLFLSFIILNLAFSQGQLKHNISYDNKGNINSVEFDPRLRSPSTSDEFFLVYLKPLPKNEFRQIQAKQKKANEKHLRFDLYYNGVRVEGAGYTLHFLNEQLTFAQGHHVVVEKMNTIASITENEASTSFANFLGIPLSEVKGHKSELIIKEIQESPTPKLVYKISLNSSHQNNVEIGFVDAETGVIIITEPRFTHVAATGTLATRYNGTVQASTESINGSFRLEDLTRGAPITTWNLAGSTDILLRTHLTDNDNNWTAAEHSASENDMGLDIHWGLQRIYDHLNSFGLNSFDDNGWPIDAHIRFGNSSALKDNARWDLDADVLLFGDGDVLFKPLASIDVVGHEFGHGLTDFQMGWAYTGMGQVFHEGISDIWGAIFEYRIKGSNSNYWKIGEQVINNGKTSLRNIQNTTDSNTHSPIADTYQSSQYNNGDHYVKSGVFSHWFYILTSGESGTNDNGTSYNVAGIGMDKAEDIMLYSIVNNYLDFTGTYPDVRTAIINATIAKYCDNSPEVRAVTNAWNAVGVGATFSGTTPSITGTALICTSQVFNVQNQIAGTSLFWSSSNGSVMSVSPQTGGTTTATRLNSANAGAGVNLTLVGTGGCSTTITRSVWLGAPVLGNQRVDGGSYSSGMMLCAGNHWANVTPPAESNAANATWTVQSGVPFVVGTNQLDFTINSNVSSVSFTAKAANTCAPSGGPNTSFFIVRKTFGCSGSFSITAYPNPVSDELTIETASTTSEIAPSVESAALISNSGEVIAKGDNVEGKTRINVKGIPKGQYFLHVTVNGNIFKEQIIIDR